MMNDLFIPFYSATYSRKYLTEKYEAKQISQLKTKSYQVCSSFMYHLQHGQLYFNQAINAPIEIKPVLLFYGAVQLLKACILTVDPNYPENSQVLAHGVTTRKRKKSTYRFLDDEVKIQKNGLFSHFLDKMFHMKHLEGEKYHMVTLFHHIAEMHPLFQRLTNKSLSFKGELKQKTILLPPNVLDRYHMTVNRFEQYVEANTVTDKSIKVKVAETKENVQITCSHLPPFWNSNPWIYDCDRNIYFFQDREHLKVYSLPELATHFLLLYNLSMICRYEAEWWGDLIHTFDGVDFPYISHYLHVVERKIPLIISSFLEEPDSV
ncbi:YaaC family protein [Halalkalibacter flavus]|uniref:YaaC family protein n=1 Tax=Halalkalibacter flavus TaxID=3090668 RepID=UPI002FC8AE4F